MVVVSDCAASAAAFPLSETYDRWNLWRLPAILVENIRRLDLDLSLNGANHASELDGLLQNMNWENVPLEQRVRTIRFSDFDYSPGPGADSPHGYYVYFEPHRAEVIN